MSWWSIPAFAMLVLGAGCGRVGFASQGDAGDGDASARDASLPPAVGELDPSFGQDGVTTVSSAGAEVVMWDILERPGGYLAHGYHRVPGTATSFAFLGLTESGQPDATYQSTPGEPGVLRFGLGTNHFGYALTRLGADRLAVAGDGNMGTSDNVIAGIVDERGVPDPTFGFRQVDLEGADLGDTAHAVTSIGDDVLVCGTQDYPATDSHLALLRLGPTGQLVSSWGFGGLTLDDLSAASTDACVDIVRHGTGVVVFAAIGAGMGLVRYLASGLRDSAFGAGGVVTVIPSGSGHTVVEVDGDLVAGGVEGGDGVLARYAPDGAPRTTFGTGGRLRIPSMGRLADVFPQSDGSLFIVGTRGAQGLIARIDAQGVIDTSFGAGGFVLVSDADPVVLTGGTYDSRGNVVAVGYAGAPARALVVRVR